jgi:two-component system, sensor histidine kinase
VFSLSVPLGRIQDVTAQPAAAADAAPESGSVRHRVLLVEDDPGVRDATRMLLTVQGYRVRAVASLAEALRSAQQEGAPDLLITDYHLRDGEFGTQVITALRENLRTEVKAVLVTGDTSTVVKHMRDDPCLRIASKPIDAEQLLQVVNELLTG